MPPRTFIPLVGGDSARPKGICAAFLNPRRRACLAAYGDVMTYLRLRFVPCSICNTANSAGSSWCPSPAGGWEAIGRVRPAGAVRRELTPGAPGCPTRPWPGRFLLRQRSPARSRARELQSERLTLLDEQLPFPRPDWTWRGGHRLWGITLHYHDWLADLAEAHAVSQGPVAAQLLTTYLQGLARQLPAWSCQVPTPLPGTATRSPPGSGAWYPALPRPALALLVDTWRCAANSCTASPAQALYLELAPGSGTCAATICCATPSGLAWSGAVSSRATHGVPLGSRVG